MRGNRNTPLPSAVPARPGRQEKRRSHKNRRPHFTPREARLMILRGSLPPGSIISGNLNFYDGSTPKFPPGTHIKGNLRLFGCGEGTRLGPGITIDGVADFTGSALTSLPKRLKVGIGLDVSKTLVRVFPPSLKVGEIIHIDESATRAMRAVALELARKNGYRYPTAGKPYHRSRRLADAAVRPVR